MSRSRRSVAVVIAVVREVQRHQVTFLAAAIAYYAFVSILPLLVLAFAIGTALGGERIATEIVRATGGVLAPTGEELVRDAVLNAADREQATLIGAVFLLWSSLKFFRGLDIAFSRVYGASEIESLPDQVRDAVIVLGTISTAVLVAVLARGVAPAVLRPPFDSVTMLILPLALVAAFFPIYYVFPDESLTVREVLPGTLIVALSWTAFTEMFAFYAENAAQFSVYGALGAVLLFVTWLYLAGIVIILGGILNAVLAGRTTDQDGADATDGEREDGPAPDVVELERELEELRDRVESRTLSRESLQKELKGYVRARMRRGHARGWGPYLVLLYGTGMTLGAFYLLDEGWAILAMLVVWLSTLGLYALMVLVGVGFSAAGLPGRIFDRVR